MHLFKSQLEEGSIYGIKNFKVLENTRKYKATTNKTRLIFNERTKLRELFPRDFPNKMFNFKSFDNIQNIETGYDSPLIGT